jgi:hypothetical protein
MEILISIFTGILLMELYAWLDPLAKWLVERVAKKLPDECQAAFKEQFMADLAAFPNSFAKVYFAFCNCTMAAQNIYEEVYRENMLSLSDDLVDVVRLIDLKVSLKDYDPYISVMDKTLATLRRHQQPDDHEAKVAIDRFQAVISPVVAVLSAVQDFQKQDRMQDRIGRLRDARVSVIEVNEAIRRRVLDEKPLDEDDKKLVTLVHERLKKTRAKLDGLLPIDLSDIPTIPDDFDAQLKATLEALLSAAQAVQRSKQKSA